LYVKESMRVSQGFHVELLFLRILSYLLCLLVSEVAADVLFGLLAKPKDNSLADITNQIFHHYYTSF
jgi:hypothetical protein